MATLAEGDIRVNLHDADARRDLRRLESDVDRAFNNMDRKRAFPEVDIDHHDFDRAYREVEAKLAKLRAERARALVKMDVRGMREVSAKIKETERQLRAFDGRRYSATLRVDVDRDGARAVSDLEKTLNRLRDPRFFQNLRGKVGLDLDEGDLRRIEHELQSRISKIERHKATLFLAGDTNGIAKAAADIEVLRRQLERVSTEANNARQVLRRDPLVIRPELDRRELREMEHEILRTIDKFKKERVQIRIRGDTHDLARVNNDLAQLDADLVALRRRRVEIKVDFDRNRIKQGFKNLFGAGGLEGIQHTVGRASKAWQEFGGSVLGAGIRLGPLTLRLRTAITVMTVLGPLLVSLTGAFGALAGVLYTGLLGTLGPAVAGVGILGTGLAGIGGVLVPLIQDFGRAEKAISAYDKTVREHGKHSDEAKKKLEVLNNVMGNTAPGTRQAVRDVNKLGSTWKRLTADARPAFFDTVAEGVRSAKALMPLFARESTKTFQGAAKEVREWFKGLRGGEARNIFRDLFKGAQAAIPNLQRSLGNIVTFLGRIAQAATPLFVEFTKTIEGWTKGWADAAKDKGGVQDFLNRTKDAVVDIGKFIGASGRLLHNFFSGGTEAGQGLLRTVTDLFNRWADFLGTTKGQNALHDFFARSVRITEKFFSILGQIGKFFFQATQNPFLISMAEGLITLVQWITKLMNLIPGLNAAFGGLIIGATFLRAIGPITKFIAVLSAAKAAIAAFAGAQGMARAVEAISAFGTRYRNVLGRPGATAPGALTTVAAEGAAGTAAGVASGRAAAADKAAAAGKKLAYVEKGVTKELVASNTATAIGVSRFASLGAAATSVAGLTLGAATAFALTAYSANKLFNAISPTKDAAERLGKAWKDHPAITKAAADSQRALTQTGLQYAQSTLTVEAGERRVNQLRRQGKTGTAEYKQAVLDLEGAYAQQNNAQVQLERNERRALDTAGKRVQNIRDYIRAQKDLPSNPARERSIQIAQEQLNKALSAQVAAIVNVQRAQKGLAAVTGENGLKMGYLVKQFQKLPKGDQIKKFFVQADTKQAEAGIRNITRLQRAGVSDKQIISVLANTDDAETALLKLRALAKNLPKINMDINAKDNATPKANQAVAAARRLVRSFIANLLAKDQATGKAASAVAVARRLARTFAAQLAARDGASPIISGALALLNSFNGKTATSTITTRHVQINESYSKLHSGGRSDPRVRAMGAVESRQAKKGLRVNRATYIAGEENRDEFVVSTNPAYRRRNRKIVKVAARALGIRNLDDREEVNEVLNDDRDTFLGLPAYAKGKGPSKKTKRIRRQRARAIGRTRRKWNRIVSGEQRKVDSIDKDIKDRIQKRDQDEQQFGINLDNDPIVKTRKNAEGEDEDYVDEGARSSRIAALENLKSQTTEIMRRYDDLKQALKQAIAKMRDAVEQLKNRLHTATRKRLGKDLASKSRQQIAEDISQITEDEKDAKERLHDIGERDTRGEQRTEQLQWNTFDAEQRQVRQTTVASQQDKAAGGPTADQSAQLAQAQAQADFFRRSSEVNEAALRTFSGARDVGFGSSSVAGALSATVTPPAVAPTVGAALASAAAQGASRALSAVSAPGRSETPAVGGGGGPSIVINTLHPADPSTLDAIGRAATGGIGLQGARLSPREAAGI